MCIKTTTSAYSFSVKSEMYLKTFYTFALIVAVTATPLESSCSVTSYDDISDAVSSCTTLTISAITVPAKTTLSLSLQSGTVLTLAGTWQWGYAEWDGPLLEISGSGVTVKGDDVVLDGQGLLQFSGD